MPEKVESKTAGAAARGCRGLWIACALALGWVGGYAAEQTAERPAEVVAATFASASAAVPPAPAGGDSAIIVPDDPLFELLTRFKLRFETAPQRAVVIDANGPVVVSGWSLPREEPLPAASAGTSPPRFLAGDPEVARASGEPFETFETFDASATPAIPTAGTDAGPTTPTAGRDAGPATPRRAPRHDDPEMIAPIDPDETPPSPPVPNPRHPQAPILPDAPRYISGEDLDTEPTVALKANATGGDARATATKGGDARATDVPRFASGAGLDSDDFEMAPASAAAGVAANSAAPRSPVAVPVATGTAAGPASRVRVAGVSKPGPATLNLDDDQRRLLQWKAEIDRNNEILASQFPSSIDKTVAIPGLPNAEGGESESELLRVRTWRAAEAIKVLQNRTPLGTLSGKIIDSVTRQPAPARVRITDMTDTAVQASHPEGFFCDGTFSVPVVSGLVKIEVSRGPFYPPIVQRVEVKPNINNNWEVISGHPAELDFSARGWQRADFNIALSAQKGERPVWFGAGPGIADLALAARAEGVQVLGVPLPWGSASSPEQVQALAAAQRDVLLLPAFAGPRHVFHGCGMGLGLKSWQGLPAEINVPEVPLREAFEDIRARGGLAVYTQLDGRRSADIRREILPLFPRLEKSGFYGPQASGSARLFAAGELAFDTIAGPAYDLLAFDGSESAQKIWFNLLNQGYRVAAIGAPANSGSLEGGRLPSGTTFVQAPAKPTREQVLSAVRAGRTGISFGPAVFCRILERDKGVGATLSADGRSLTLQIQAWSSLGQSTQLDLIEIVRNGQVVHSQAAAEGEAAIPNLCWSFSESGTAWYMVRVTERRNSAAGPQRGGAAWTSPIFFEGPAFAERKPSLSRIRGTLLLGPNPVQGTVTAVLAGQAPRQVAADGSGRFDVELPVSGTLVCEAPGCEPLALRVFEHPRIQQALGALQAQRNGTLAAQLAEPSLLPAWRLLVSDLEWNINLVPLRPAPKNGDSDSDGDGATGAKSAKGAADAAGEPLAQERPGEVR